jgi:DNA repair protein RadA/Sms
MSINGKPLPIEIFRSRRQANRYTGIAEVDRVLGGGIVGGSAILIGGRAGHRQIHAHAAVMHNLAIKD